VSSVPAGPPAFDIYRITVARAAELCGGAVPLSRRLRLPLADLTRWISGDDTPPIGIFLLVIDVINEESRRPRLHPRTDQQEPKDSG